MVSDPKSHAARQRILVMLAVALRRYRATAVQADPPVRDAVQEQVVGAGLPASPRNASSDLVFIDGSDRRAPVDPLVPMSVIVIAPKGISRGKLRSVASEHRTQDLLGVVLVDVRRARVVRDQAAPATLDDRTIEPA